MAHYFYGIVSSIIFFAIGYKLKTSNLTTKKKNIYNFYCAVKCNVKILIKYKISIIYIFGERYRCSIKHVVTLYIIVKSLTKDLM